MNKTRWARAALALAAALSGPACDTPVGPVIMLDDDRGPAPTFVLTTQTIPFDHRVGVTDCPQLIGEYVIESRSDVPIRVRSETAPPLLLERVSSSTPSGRQRELEVVVGENVRVRVYFDCSTRESFNSTITVRNLSGETRTITVRGTVSR